MQEDKILRWIFNPVPPGLCHVTYYHAVVVCHHGDKKYPCPGGIRLSNIQDSTANPAHRLAAVLWSVLVGSIKL